VAKGLFLVTNEAPNNRGDYTPVRAGIQKTKHIQQVIFGLGGQICRI
jgi:hypothetical protein